MIERSDLLWLAELLTRRAARSERDAALATVKGRHPELVRQIRDDSQRSMRVAQLLLNEASKPEG